MGVRTVLREFFNPDSGMLSGVLTALTGCTTSQSTFTTTVAVPSWVVASMPVYDVTAAGVVGTVASISASTVTLNANATTAVAIGDTLQFGIPTTDITESMTAPYTNDIRGNMAGCVLALDEIYKRLTDIKAIMTAAGDSTNASIMTTELAALS
jgi:hypothetical protein